MGIYRVQIRFRYYILDSTQYNPLCWSRYPFTPRVYLGTYLTIRQIYKAIYTYIYIYALYTDLAHSSVFRNPYHPPMQLRASDLGPYTRTCGRLMVDM